MNERHCRPGWTMCLLILEPRRLCWASQWTRGLRTRYCSKASPCYLLSSGSNNVIARRILLQPITVWHVYGIGCSHDHVSKITCYSLYSKCLCPIRTWTGREIWDGQRYCAIPDLSSKRRMVIKTRPHFSAMEALMSAVIPRFCPWAD